MSRHDNSLNAYYQIRDEGLLSKMRMMVYEVIVKHGPINATQIYREHLRHVQQHSVTPRFSELLRQGVIKLHHTAPCPYTGYESDFFVQTNQLPKKLPKGPKKYTYKQSEERRVAYYKALVAIWQDKRTPKFIRDIIREHTKHLKKDKT